MKPITKLTKEDVKDLKIVCFDVDGVTVKKGTDIKEVRTEETTTLTVTTNNLSDVMLQKMIRLKEYYMVAIASGRSSLYLTKIYSDLLWHNTALSSEIGIFTLINGQLIQHEKFNEMTLEKMRNIFNAIKKLEGVNKDFRAFEPKQFLITVHAWNELKEIDEIMKTYDPEGEFYNIWNGEAHDIAPKRLNKGTALKNMANHLGVAMSQTMAIGNGPNDKDMMDAAGIGITTEPDTIPSDYYTTGSQHLGGEQLVDILLELNK